MYFITTFHISSYQGRRLYIFKVFIEYPLLMSYQRSDLRKTLKYSKSWTPCLIFEYPTSRTRRPCILRCSFCFYSDKHRTLQQRKLAANETGWKSEMQQTELLGENWGQFVEARMHHLIAAVNVNHRQPRFTSGTMRQLARPHWNWTERNGGCGKKHEELKGSISTLCRLSPIPHNSAPITDPLCMLRRRTVAPGLNAEQATYRHKKPRQDPQAYTRLRWTDEGDARKV